MSNYYKGICYQPFPKPYDPSTANKTCIFFGSDIAYDPMGPIWGKSYKSSTGSICSNCRNDLQMLKEIGVNLIRLYDWDARNHHLKFMDYCAELGIKILVPVSNWWLQDSSWNDDQLKGLIASFLNSDKKEYHRAVAGVLIGNEPGLNGISVQRCIDVTKTYFRLEKTFNMGAPPEARPIIGHPVDFSLYGGQYPCWGFWEPLLNSLDASIKARIFLAPQTYNDYTYLFENAENSGKGWVPLTYQKFQKWIIFTEIGVDRTKPNYLDTVKGQLTGCRKYSQSFPTQLGGACYFQFADKVWMQGTSEGSFGACSHSDNIRCTVTYGNGDFTHWDNGSCAGQKLSVDELTKNPVYNVIVGS